MGEDGCARGVDRHERRAAARRPRLWVIVGWALLPVVAGAQRWAPSAWVEDRYAEPIYPRIAFALSAVNRRAPFSLAEAAVWALLAVAAILSARAGVHAARARAVPWRGALRAMGRGAALLGWALLLFSLLWGLNYRRPPMAHRLGIPTGGTPTDLLATAQWLARQVLDDTPAGTGPTRLPYTRDALMVRIEDAYERAESAGTFKAAGAQASRLPGAGGTPARRQSAPTRRPAEAGKAPVPTVRMPDPPSHPVIPSPRHPVTPSSPHPLGPAKLVCASGVLCYLGLSGIFIPFTGEPNVNRLVPDPDLVFAVAHEKAHQRGIAPENEANFAAFLALTTSDDPYLRYCGAHDAAGYVLRALARVDPKAARSVVRSLAGRPMADWERSRDFWSRYRGPVQRASQSVNDIYLRANRVPGGVQSYGAVTDLLVGYHRARHE